MATTINQAFSEYKTNLEIKDRQVWLVSTRRVNAVEALAKKLSLHSSMPSKLIGSYDRHTLTRYLSEGDSTHLRVQHYNGIVEPRRET